MRPKPEVPTYKGGLDTNELLDWINEMDKFFDYDEMNEERKVKFAVTRLKGHASLWWNGVQTERRNQEKVPIKNWDRMVAKLRGKFLPKDFQISLFKQDAKPETEDNDCEGVHRGVLQDQLECRICARHNREGG